MGTASLNGKTFRIDPNEVSWDFRAKTTDVKTVGGKVVQIFGTSVGSMTVRGQFGVGSVFEQYAMLKEMKAAGDRMVVDANVRNQGATPMRFLFPKKGWDFQVYLRSFTEIGRQRAVHHAVDHFSLTWDLTFFIVQDNTGLKKVAEDAFIKRLAVGLGWRWQQSRYNGPMEGLQEALGGRTVADTLAEGYGIAAQTPSGSTGEPPDVAAGTPTSPSAGTLSKAQMLDLYRSVGFTGDGLRMAYAISMAESRGKVDAHNTNTRTGDNSYGLFQINMINTLGPARRQQYGLPNNEALFDAATNAQVAFKMSSNGTNWSAWSTFKRGEHIRFYNEGI